VHCSICKASFSDADIKTNLQAVLADLKKAKPASAKGVFLKKLTLSSTMGVGVAVDLSTVEE
jgi:large subunit ribosomal protein L1